MHFCSLTLHVNSQERGDSGLPAFSRSPTLVGVQPPLALLRSGWQRARESPGECAEARTGGDTYHFCTQNFEECGYMAPPNCKRRFKSVPLCAQGKRDRRELAFSTVSATELWCISTCELCSSLCVSIQCSSHLICANQWQTSYQLYRSIKQYTKTLCTGRRSIFCSTLTQDNLRSNEVV